MPSCALRRKNDKTLETILATLDDLLKQQAKTYLVIDALDECPEEHGKRHTLLNGVSDLLGKHDNLHVIMTSRDQKDIREAMRSNQATSIRLSEENINADIQLFVERRLERDIDFDKGKKKVLLEHETEIKQAFKQKAGGM